ncbi:hypothetical protein GM415_07330 [Pseudodesulfovibrio cashew]|uniref:Uncharacterized protein n=1 Tax=Pseudodesulfovibrio cashew TaxID=2678688 RepID=A0A6I6JQK8_9BACT|nr:hypothetical protein [Pseudodesulfovibrio cashew]QGY39944.1 hypothetical protein GM415_07330 [Pseudodesulfovibrio cashew]
MHYLCRLLLLQFLLLFLAVHPAFAEEPSFTSRPGFLLAAPTNVSTKLRMEADVSYVENSDFTNGLGSVAVARTTISADYSIFHFSYGISHFMWEDKGQVTFASSHREPWDNLYDVTLQARLLNNRFWENWRYWVNGELSSSFERDFPGAVGAGFDGGVAYDFWDGWMLGITAKTVALSALHQDLFGDVEFGLAVAVSQKTLRETLKRMGFFPALPGGSDKIGFSMALSGADKTYRLSPDSPVRKNGYLGLVRAKVGAYLDYSPDKSWTISVGPEYHYNRRYKLYDSQGKLHSTHRLADGWGGYARVLYTF